MADLTTIFHHLQRRLFPALTDELGPLSALDQQFCEVISLTDLGRFTRRYEGCGNPPEQTRAAVLCVDEKSQVQALERSQPVLPMRPGQAESAHA